MNQRDNKPAVTVKSSNRKAMGRNGSTMKARMFSENIPSGSYIIDFSHGWTEYLRYAANGRYAMAELWIESVKGPERPEEILAGGTIDGLPVVVLWPKTVLRTTELNRTLTSLGMEGISETVKELSRKPGCKVIDTIDSTVIIPG